MSRYRRAIPILALPAVAACMGGTAMTVNAPIPRTCDAIRPEAAGAHVGWYHPAGVEDNRRLEAWCHAVGPVIVDSLATGSFDPMDPDDVLVVAAWNTDAGSGFLTDFLSKELGLLCDGAESRLADGASHFVLLVQEALRRSNTIPEVEESWAVPPPVSEREHPGDRLDVLEVAAACGLSAFYAPAGRNGLPARDGLREDKGNAILSTLPQSEFVVVELPYEASRRVAPIATVRGPSGESLRVASIHFITTPPPWRILTTGNTARLRQALALEGALEAMERSRGAEVATVVGGDTNASSLRETALRRLRDLFPDSPGPLPRGTRGPFPTDHLFFRSGASDVRVVEGSYRRITDTYYSDHNPVIALVRFGARAVSLDP